MNIRQVPADLLYNIFPGGDRNENRQPVTRSRPRHRSRQNDRNDSSLPYGPYGLHGWAPLGLKSAASPCAPHLEKSGRKPAATRIQAALLPSIARFERPIFIRSSARRIADRTERHARISRDPTASAAGPKHSVYAMPFRLKLALRFPPNL